MQKCKYIFSTYDLFINFYTFTSSFTNETKANGYSIYTLSIITTSMHKNTEMEGIFSFEMKTEMWAEETAIKDFTILP
jgi:hypothetical protein